MPRVSRRGWTSPRPPARVFSPSAKESSHSLTACRPSTRSTRPSAWVRSPTLRLRVGRDANGGPFDDVRFVPTWDATGRLARMRVRRGARFQTGDRLGTVYGGEFRSLNVRVFERHDLALAKLGRNQDYEREDVRRLAHGPGLDVALLEQRYRDELRRQLGNSEREDPTLKAVDRDDQRGEQPLRRRAIACKCAATTPHATASSPYERAVAQFAEGLP